MIGIYQDDGTRLTMGYRSVTINNDSYPVGSIVVDPAVDAVTEPKASRHGMEAYAARRLQTLVRVEGVVKAGSVAQLHDRIEALNEAFDPVRATEVDSAADRNNGFLPFTFSVPTEDTTNYPTGLKGLQYYARSLALPVPRTSKFEGDGARYSIVLQAADPRRYLQEESSGERIGAGELVLDNSLASFSSWPTVRVSITGAGTQEISLQRVHSFDTRTLWLDLTGTGAGEWIDIDMEHRTIKRNDNDAMQLYDGLDYWWMLPGENTINVVDRTGTLAGTVEVTWRRAFV